MPPAARFAEPFKGDYSTNDFSQWNRVETVQYVGEPKRYKASYSARVVDDSVYGKAARFEVRAGDIPFGKGERSEVSGEIATTGGVEGQTRWYRFATKFDTSFPRNQADLGWAVTNQWHPDSDKGSPLLSWSPGFKNGMWSLLVNTQKSPGAYTGTKSIFDTPLELGEWHDVRMQVHWSTSEGWVRVWHNGDLRILASGSDTYYLPTLIPGTTSVYYKEGLYREPTAKTGIVYHAGFRSASGEYALNAR
ncbi:polysaccharide lyase [Mycolicibacterium gilvum]|nr:polysaccharide lyase [Mycolicibacterium gilvum]